MIKEIFNLQSDFLHKRCMPPVPDDLAARIILSATQMLQGQDTVLAFLLIPRPAVILTLLLMLSMFIGLEIDLGFNSADDLLLSEESLLLSFEEDGLL